MLPWNHSYRNAIIVNLSMQIMPYRRVGKMNKGVRKNKRDFI